jgi:hypothetical protein
VNELVIQWLAHGEPDLLHEVVPALAPLLLKSIGVFPVVAPGARAVSPPT